MLQTAHGGGKDARPSTVVQRAPHLCARYAAVSAHGRRNVSCGQRKCSLISSLRPSHLWAAAAIAPGSHRSAEAMALRLRLAEKSIPSQWADFRAPIEIAALD